MGKNARKIFGFLLFAAVALLVLWSVNSTSRKAADTPVYIQGTDDVSSLSLKLNRQSCQIKSDGETVYCQWEDGNSQTIHHIEMVDMMYFFNAKIAGLEAPAVVVSDVNGVSGGGLIWIYRYDLTQEEWQRVQYDGRDLFFGFARFDADGDLILAERFPIDLGGWGLHVYSLTYDAEQDCISLEGPTIYNDTDLLWKT